MIKPFGGKGRRKGKKKVPVAIAFSRITANVPGVFYYHHSYVLLADVAHGRFAPCFIFVRSTYDISLTIR